VTSLPDKAFVDTSVLVDALMKQSAQGVHARAALLRYSETQLPVYTIKELKAGALRNYVWFHNKVATTDRWDNAVDAIRRIGATPRRYLLSTALQALTDFNSSLGKRLLASLAKKYPGASEGEMKRAEAQIWLKTTIMRAWRKRRSLTTKVVNDLSCYRETDPTVKVNGMIDDRPVKCSVSDCCLRQEFIAHDVDVANLLSACNALADKSETMKRRKVLRQLHRTPKRNLIEEDCRALGDAVFALQCPTDAEVLTTNLGDHKPLAEAIGKTAVAP
jgi:predicted nucleic acid-binding protein